MTSQIDVRADAPAAAQPARGERRLRLGWALVAIWLAAVVTAQLKPTPAAVQVAGAAQALALVLFVAVHASLSYGWKGFAAFFGITLAVAFALEASSIHTGFPFGFYAHGDSFGPKLLGVPPPVALGYVFLGYLAWSLARLLVRDRPTEARGLAVFTTPLVGTFVLAGYDFAYDPIGSTVLGLWTYRYPSGHFGVPLSNFLGWLLTGWMFLQLFALMERRFRPALAAQRKTYWLQPCVVWAATALQFLPMLAQAPAGSVTRGGRTFLIADVYEAAAITALLTMLFAAVAAAARLAGGRDGAT